MLPCSPFSKQMGLGWLSVVSGAGSSYVLRHSRIKLLNDEWAEAFFGVAAQPHMQPTPQSTANVGRRRRFFQSR